LTAADFAGTINNAIGFFDLVSGSAIPETAIVPGAGNTTVTVYLTGGQANATPAPRVSTLNFSVLGVPADAVTITQMDAAAPATPNEVTVSQFNEVPINETREITLVINRPLGATHFYVDVPVGFAVSAVGAPAEWNVTTALGNGTMVAPGGTTPGGLVPVDAVGAARRINVEMGRPNNITGAPNAAIGDVIFTITAAPITPTLATTPPTFYPFPIIFVNRFGDDVSHAWNGTVMEPIGPLTQRGSMLGLWPMPPQTGWVNMGGMSVIDRKPVIMGDLNRDGRVSSADIAILARAVVDGTFMVYTGPDTPATPTAINNPANGGWSAPHASIGCNVAEYTNAARPPGTATTRLGQWLVGSIPAADSGGWMCMLADRTTCINVFRPGFGPTIDDAITGLPAHVSAGCENRVITPDIFVPRPGFVYF